MMNSLHSHALQIMQIYLKPFKSPNPDSEHAWIVVPVVITAQIMANSRFTNLLVDGILQLQMVAP